MFTQSNAQVQRWRGKGLLMFPGLFIQPSVWLRTNSHPPSHRALLRGFPPQMTSPGLRSDWWRAQCGLCERGRKERSCNFHPHVFQGKLSTHSSIYKGNKSANSRTTTVISAEGWGALLSISKSLCNFLYKHWAQGFNGNMFHFEKRMKSELCVETSGLPSFWADVQNIIKWAHTHY